MKTQSKQAVIENVFILFYSLTVYDLGLSFLPL